MMQTVPMKMLWWPWWCVEGRPVMGERGLRIRDRMTSAAQRLSSANRRRFLGITHRTTSLTPCSRLIS